MTIFTTRTDALNEIRSTVENSIENEGILDDTQLDTLGDRLIITHTNDQGWATGWSVEANEETFWAAVEDVLES